MRTPLTIRVDGREPFVAVEYGNGVYYFKHIGEDFAIALSAFLEANPNLEVSAMTGNVVRRANSSNVNLSACGFGYDYGAAVGYFVTFREKEIKANKAEK